MTTTHDAPANTLNDIVYALHYFDPEEGEGFNLVEVLLMIHRDLRRIGNMLDQTDPR
jgi:hypothetical protein